MHKHAKRLLALAALSLAATAASAQSWLTQPIRWIVPYPAGGGADVVARTVAGGMENRWARPSWSRTAPARPPSSARPPCPRPSRPAT